MRLAGTTVAVIGSGMGGAAAGALLAARGGARVKLFEKNGIVGGRFASYERDGFRLDVGCHAIASGANGAIGRILDLVGMGEGVQWARTRNAKYVYLGQWIRFPKEIDKLGIAAEEVASLFRLFTDIVQMEEPALAELDSLDLATFVRRYTQDPRALALFTYISGMYFCVGVTETPAGLWARCQKEIMTFRSSAYPVGGTVAPVRRLLEAIQRHGGEVSTKRPVERILVEKGRAVGVALKGGTVERADIVVSNVDVKTTVTRLVGESHYGPAFLQKVHGWRYSDLNFTVKIALDASVTDEYFIVYIGRDDIDRMRVEWNTGLIPAECPFLMIPVVSNLDPTAAPPGKQLIFAGTGCGSPPDSPPEVWKEWEASCLAAVRKVFPGIDEHILWVESTSPKTIDKLFGEGGNIIGVAQSLDQVGPNRPPIADPCVEGLYYASADSGTTGIGGEAAADAALKLYELLAGERIT